jgi:hypothetical protein
MTYEKKRPRHSVVVADGTPIWPNDLAKMCELAARARHLLKSRNVRRFESPEFRVFTAYAGAVVVEFIYEDGRVKVYKQTGEGRHDYVDKDLLSEALDALKREQVLDDLGDIL